MTKQILHNLSLFVVVTRRVDDARHRTRSIRAPNAPSVPVTCGSGARNRPQGERAIAGISSGRASRKKQPPRSLAKKDSTTPSFSSGSVEQVL